ncbi:MAG: 5-(carboxyamino)imidazole ribonucleotide synthase [Streptosporangiales bacterium]|nr:5-(carboxyamino)imidazole ribonucleotide synthase [Streptosporangiales bacterium]
MSERNRGMPVVGMVGGGQLARMTHQAAIGLGVGLRVMAAAADDSAALVCADARLGDYRSLDDLQVFARGIDVLTFDHEHVPNRHLRTLEAAGVAVRPGPAALRHAQDKIAMRSRLTEIGAPSPRWCKVADLADVSALAERTGWPVVLKAARGGYDGKGVWLCGTPEEARAVIERAAAENVPLLAEERVEFRREVAALVARSPHGQGAAYPLVETAQRDGICHEVIAPAPGLDLDRAAEAQRLALDIAAELGVVGLLAVELFETAEGMVVNELAMRPHNSGHWTIEGANTSQFEQHLRAVLDLPLGSPQVTAPVVVMANLLGGADPDVYGRYVHVMAKDPTVKVHLYGKSVRPGRKIGHVTALGEDLDDVLGRARDAAAYLKGPAR